MDFQQYVLKGIKEESADVRTFRFAREGGSPPAYQPGHFFLLRMAGPDGKPIQEASPPVSPSPTQAECLSGPLVALRQVGASQKWIQRSYSVASHPDEPELAFCIKLKGTFTHMLWKLKTGDTIEIDGPYGIFLLNPADTERVFIGGGVGISALRPMILQTAGHDAKRAWLFHCAHTFEGLAYFPEMKKLAAENPLFKFYPSVSGEEKPPGWNGWSGRISVAKIKEMLGSLSEKTFYFCGGKEMGAEISSALLAEGVPKDRIKKDEWG